MSRTRSLFAPALCAAIVLSAQAVCCLGGEAEKKILVELDKPTTLDFIDTPLTDVVDYLKDLHGIEIQLDRRALDEAGIGTDAVVTRNLEGISLRLALRLILRELDLTYVIQDEVLLLTTREAAKTRMYTIVYPVGDLVGRRDESGKYVYDLEAMEAILTECISPDTWDHGANVRPAPFEGVNALVVRQTQAVHGEISALLRELRRLREKHPSGKAE